MARYLGLTARRVTRRPLDHAAAATHAKARSLPSPRVGHLRLLARCLSPGKLGGGSFQIATVALLEPAVLPSDRTGPVGANVARASLPSSFLGFPCLSLATLARGGGRCQPCIFTVLFSWDPDLRARYLEPLPCGEDFTVYIIILYYIYIILYNV